MAKQTFTTGQVLTAAQMTSLQQTAMLGGAASAKTASYTLVAADAGSAISMSNASATTITVNTALFAAGDTVHITNLGAGVCTITAGTATVNSSASLALAQYESGFLDFTSTSAAIFVKGAGVAAGGGMTLLSTTTLSGSSTTISSISGDYVSLHIVVSGVNPSSNQGLRLAPNNVTNQVQGISMTRDSASTGRILLMISDYLFLTPGNYFTSGNTSNIFGVQIDNYASATAFKPINLYGGYFDDSSRITGASFGGYFGSTTAITSLVFSPTSGTFNGGTVLLYGVK
jgi:hypothetical protein